MSKAIKVAAGLLSIYIGIAFFVSNQQEKKVIKTLEATPELKYNKIKCSSLPPFYSKCSIQNVKFDLTKNKISVTSPEIAFTTNGVDRLKGEEVYTVSSNEFYIFIDKAMQGPYSETIKIKKKKNAIDLNLKAKSKEEKIIISANIENLKDIYIKNFSLKYTPIVSPDSVIYDAYLNAIKQTTDAKTINKVFLDLDTDEILPIEKVIKRFLELTKLYITDSAAKKEGVDLAKSIVAVVERKADSIDFRARTTKNCSFKKIIDAQQENNPEKAFEGIMCYSQNTNTSINPIKEEVK